MSYITLFFDDIGQVVDYIADNIDNIKSYDFRTNDRTYITTYDNKRIECII